MKPRLHVLDDRRHDRVGLRVRRREYNSYGHLVIALDNVARTLAAKVESGDYSEERALDAGRRILHQNPNEFFSPERVLQK